MNTAAEDRVVTINNHPYKFSDLSEEARKQFLSLRVTDQEIERLQNQLAMVQTARNAYAQALSRALPQLPKTTLQ
jgi:hypothetical protein